MSSPAFYKSRHFLNSIPMVLGVMSLVFVAGHFSSPSSSKAGFAFLYSLAGILSGAVLARSQPQSQILKAGVAISVIAAIVANFFL